jgi:predicted nucleic acid-binding protein
LLRPFSVVSIDDATHRAAVSALLAGGPMTLVDLVSFEVMRRLQIETAFAFDPDFARQGFALVP